jgi:hypothetical protein
LREKVQEYLKENEESGNENRADEDRKLLKELGG